MTKEAININRGEDLNLLAEKFQITYVDTMSLMKGT